MTLTMRAARPRPGFTLIELLVVISIMAVLLSITAVALQKTTEGQKNRSTNDQLYKLQQSLDAEYEQVVKKCATDGQNKLIPQPVVDYADGDPNRALAIWTAMNLRRQFPQSFSEATADVLLKDTSNGTVYYTLRHLTPFDEVSGATSAPPDDDSSALLYIILAKKSVAGGGAMANSADDLSQGMQRKVAFGSKQLNTFADAWGNSVGFRRWYTGMAGDGGEVQNKPYADATNTANKDPLDPRNLVAGWVKSDGSANTQKRSDMSTSFGFASLNRMATVFSPAKDKQPITADDIFGFRLRSFGKKG